MGRSKRNEKETIVSYFLYFFRISVGYNCDDLVFSFSCYCIRWHGEWGRMLWVYHLLNWPACAGAHNTEVFAFICTQFLFIYSDDDLLLIVVSSFSYTHIHNTHALNFNYLHISGFPARFNGFPQFQTHTNSLTVVPLDHLTCCHLFIEHPSPDAQVASLNLGSGNTTPFSRLYLFQASLLHRRPRVLKASSPFTLFLSRSVRVSFTPPLPHPPFQ